DGDELRRRFGRAKPRAGGQSAQDAESLEGADPCCVDHRIHWSTASPPRSTTTGIQNWTSRRMRFNLSALSLVTDMTHDGRVYDGEPVARTERVFVKSREVVKHGASFGSALAIAISWSVNNSIVWAII